MLPVLLAAFLFQPPPGQARRPPDPCAPAPQLYLSPMGEPFRAPPAAAYPSAVWFGAADADRDGRLTLPEFAADADRFFARLDANRDGVIDPAEVTAYETDIAPEIRLYQSMRLPRQGDRRKSERDLAYGGAMGAGRWAQLNLPQPVAAADADFNRGIDAKEWRAAAARRFAMLGPRDGALTLAGLAPTPAQDAQAACAVQAAKRRR